MSECNDKYYEDWLEEKQDLVTHLIGAEKRIAEQEAELVAFRESMRWRSSPELPKEGQFGAYQFRNEAWLIGEYQRDGFPKIVKWMPLPKPPEDSSDD